MSASRLDVVGIGNAIVDIIGRCDDAFLVKHGLAKGHMRLIEAAEVQKLYGAMGPAVEASGGSAANTMAGIASFGGRAGFIGKVADDEFGRIFGHDIRKQGVEFKTAVASSSGEGTPPTARCLVLVTPDGERTMNTFLGVSPLLDKGEVDPAMIQNARIVYLEGYLFDQAEAKAAFYQAADIATAAKAKVALSLSDSFCVDRHRDAFVDLIHSRIDILFANENELTTLYQTKDFNMAAAAARQEIAGKDGAVCVVTRGANGSVILAGDRTVEVACEPVAKVVDTTGAGDLYAAGFLYGYAKGQDLKVCGRLASVAAAEIISHIGARPLTPLATLAQQAGLPV
jgi:sugar/nucleoside kinase (ribokinase family)